MFAKQLVIGTLALILGLAACTPSGSARPSANPSRMPAASVLVIGGLHEGHERARTYTYQRMGELLRLLAPDVLCVEGEPRYIEDGTLKGVPLDFKKHMIPVARSLGIPVIGVDWWDDVLGKQWLELQDRAGSDSRLGPEARLNSSIFRSLNDYLEEVDFAAIHNPRITELWASRSRLKYDSFLRYPEYATIVTFENERNARMARGVLDVVERDRSKRVLVAVGIDHKWAIEADLKSQGVRIVEPEDVGVR